MRSSAFILITLLVIVQLSFAQDSIRVEPFDIGLPETPKICFTIQEKYGADSSKWPIWVHKGVSLMDMSLEKINDKSIRLNERLPLTLDKQHEYSTQKGDSIRPTYYDALHYQDNFIYAQVDSIIEFYSTKKPIVQKVLKISTVYNGKRIDLSSLTTVRNELPQAYDWRNVVAQLGYHIFWA